MAKTQSYGIKYPFTYNNEDLVYVDLNDTFEGSLQSQILHIIFTPKGQRLRDPEFGSDLIKFIFDPSIGRTLDGIKSEIRESISSRIPNVVLDDIQILETQDEHEKIVSVKYTVKKGETEVQNNIAIKL
jgi:phage baseplate assembly protein W